MKYLLIGIIIGAVVTVLCWITEDSIKHNAHCVRSIDRLTSPVVCHFEGRNYLMEEK